MSVSITGDIRRLFKHLNRLENFDTKGINSAMGQSIRTSTKKRFAKQKDPEGKSWLKSVRVQERGGVTLTKTARLKNSIRVKAGADGFEVGTNTIYAARHQFGDKRPITIRAKTAKGLRFKIGGRFVTKKSVKVKMPARPFLGINKADMDSIKSMLEKAVSEV